MFVNTTPHDVVLYDNKKEKVIYTFKKSNMTIRLDTEKQQFLGNLPYEDGINIPVFTAQKFTKLNTSDTLDTNKKYIVSQMVLEFAEKNKLEIHKIFYCPDTNEGAVRKDGQIVGTTRLLK